MKDANGTALHRFALPTFLLLSAGFLAACGDSTSPQDGTSPPEESPAQYAGVWEGTTGAGLAVRMVVNSSGVVDSLSLRVRLSIGLGTCTGPLLLDAPASIQGNTFDAQVTFPGSNITTTVQGTFSSVNAVSGTHGGHSGSFSLVCGSTFSTGVGFVLGSGSWQATKQ